MYSENSKKLSNYIYSMLGLFPGLLTFKFTQSQRVLKQHISYGQYGMPLQIFHRKCSFIPIFTLNELEFFDKNSGYLAGTTN